MNRRGQEFAIQDSAAPIRDRAGNLIGAVMVFHDVSKERRLHRALHYQASHDALTGFDQPARVRKSSDRRGPERAARCEQPSRAAVSRFGSIQIGQRYLRASGGRSVAETDHRRPAIAGAQRRHPGAIGRRRIRHSAASVLAGSGAAHRGKPASGNSRFSIHLAGRRARTRREYRHRRNHQRYARLSPMS